MKFKFNPTLIPHSQLIHFCGKLKAKTIFQVSKFKPRNCCTLLFLFCLLFIFPTSSKAQFSAITQTESGGSFGGFMSNVTTTISGLEVITLPVVGTVLSFNTGCSQEAEISFEICNIEEVGTVEFSINALFFSIVDSGDFNFTGTSGIGEFTRNLYSAPFEETTFDPYTNTATCVTVSMTIAINPIFNQFLGPFNLLSATIDSPSNPNTNLNIPQYQVTQALAIGADGTSTFLSNIIGTQLPNSNIVCSGAIDLSYAIFGDLIINTDYCFNNTKFFMQPGSSIRIINGSLLTVDRRAGSPQRPEFKPCGAMWKGIILEDGALAINGAIISGAETAVTVMPDNIVSVTNSNFEDNFIGVHFADNDNSTTPNNAQVFGFFSNTFSGTGELPPLYPGQTLPFFNANDLPYAGVLAEDYNLLPLLGTRFPTDLIPTKYSNMNRGIRFINTDLNSSFSVFEDIPNNAIQGTSNNNNNFFIHHGLNDDPSQPNNEQVDFLRCSNGIALTNMNAEIENSHFLEIQNRGLQFFNCKNKNVSVIKNRLAVAGGGQGILSFFSHPLAGTIENNYFTPTNIDNGIDILCFEGFSSSNDPGNSWRINSNTFDGSQGGRTAIQISGGSNFEIKENTITRSGIISGINKYGIRLTNSSFPDMDCNDISLNGQNHGLDVGIMVRSSIFGEYECNSVDNYVNNIQFENDNMRNLFKGNTMSNGDQGLVFSSTAIIGEQDHKGNCWENNNSSDLSHASPDDEIVERSLFTIRCQGEGNANNACGCDAEVSVQPTVDPEDLLLTQPFGFTESCGDDDDDEYCQHNKFAPGTPIAPTVLSDRLGNLVYTDDNANSLNWMSQFNLLRAIDDGMFTAQSQENEIFNLRSQNAELDNHLHFWNDISSNNVGTDENIALAEIFSNIHQLSLAIAESTNEAEQAALQSQLDQLKLDFEANKAVANSIAQSSNEALENIYTTYSFAENANELHLNYMAFVSNLYTDYMLNNRLNLDHNQEQLLHTIGITCLDKAGPASNIAKALYFVVSDGVVLESEDCEFDIEERSNSQETLESMPIYPNPSTGVISISLEMDAEIEIISQMGTVLRSYKLKGGTHSLDLNLPSGVYFVRDGKSLNEKLLITK